MEYLIIIAVCVGLVAYAERKAQMNTHLFWGIVVVSLLISSIFSGIRSFDTGYDIKTYVLYHFEYAKSANVVQYVRQYGSDSILYSIMICAVAKFFSDAHWMLFFIQLYINAFFYIAAYRYKYYTKKKMWVFLLVYYCVFYIYTFNIMRQGMAISMIMLACIELIYGRKYKLYFVMLALATLMHPTSILALGIPAVVIALQQKKRSAVTIAAPVFIILLTVVFILGFREIMQVLLSVGIVKDRYSYAISSLYKSRYNIETYKVAFCLLNLLLAFKLKDLENKTIKGVVIVSLSISLAAYMIGGVSTSLERIGLYYWVPSLCILSGYIYDRIRVSIGKTEIFKYIYMISMLGMCVYQFFVCDQAAAYPYVFMWEA